jgi:hypothetical protein
MFRHLTGRDMETRMIEGKTSEKLKTCISDLLAQIDTLRDIAVIEGVSIKS